MNKDLGVWTHEDCALVLIDYQKEMFEVIRSETDDRRRAERHREGRLRSGQGRSTSIPASNAEVWRPEP
jgi:hypothetical protein